MSKYWIEKVGWHQVGVLPPENRFRKNNKKKLKEIEDFLSVRQGRFFYDFRVNTDTWAIWLRKKEMPFNIQTSRK